MEMNRGASDSQEIDSRPESWLPPLPDPVLAPFPAIVPDFLVSKEWVEARTPGFSGWGRRPGKFRAQGYPGPYYPPPTYPTWQPHSSRPPPSLTIYMPLGSPWTSRGSAQREGSGLPCPSQRDGWYEAQSSWWMGKVS